MAEERKTKTEYAGGVQPGWDETPEQFIMRFEKALISANVAGYTNLKMDSGSCEGVSFTGTRPETDKEMEDRIRRERLRIETQERNDRAHYLRLKEKYG